MYENPPRPLGIPIKGSAQAAGDRFTETRNRGIATTEDDRFANSQNRSTPSPAGLPAGDRTKSDNVGEHQISFQLLKFTR